MGEVYRGRDPRLGRDVAVKVLTGDFAADSDRLRRFEAEARAAAALSHPNILAVYDVGSEGGVPYLVSEFLEGHTLRTALDIGDTCAVFGVGGVGLNVIQGARVKGASRIFAIDTVPSKEKLVGVIDTLIAAVRAGELDSILEQQGLARGVPKTKRAA
jgi:hypothetical protein